MKKKKIKLDVFEKRLEEEIERGEWVRDKDEEKIKEMLKKAAENYLKKHAVTNHK